MGVLTCIESRLAAETAVLAKLDTAFVKDLVAEVLRNAESTWPSSVFESMSKEDLLTQADYLFSGFDPVNVSAAFRKKYKAQLDVFSHMRGADQYKVFKTQFKGM